MSGTRVELNTISVYWRRRCKLWEVLYSAAQKCGLFVQWGLSCGTVALSSAVQLCTEQSSLLMHFIWHWSLFCAMLVLSHYCTNDDWHAKQWSVGSRILVPILQPWTRWEMGQWTSEFNTWNVEVCQTALSPVLWGSLSIFDTSLLRACYSNR
jgi:hypothetical protein